MRADFDIAAQTYDEIFTKSIIGSGQRHRVWEYLRHELDNSTPMRILELNCGTGEDAIFLAGLGHYVVGTDISNDMIEACRVKAQNLDASLKLNFLQLDMNTIQTKNFDHDFDLIFSNFGGLNCLSSNEIKSLFIKLESILSDQGRMVVVVMPRYCLMESIYFLMKLRFTAMFRRNTSKSLLVNVDGVDVNTFYHSPSGLSVLLSRSWISQRVQSIGFIPSYLERLVRSNRIVGGLILVVDKLMCKFNLSKVSDHYLFDVTLKKTANV